MLVLDELTFLYRGMAAPYCFSMSAAPGEITAIGGPSGAGKSTLLDLIAGFLAPSGGTLSYAGRDLLLLPPEQRPVSILFQSETLFEHLSVTDNVALGLPAGGNRRRTREQIGDALAEVGLPDIGGQLAATLSGGQKQRVALARTLLRARPVLLLDEPFSALDDESRATTRALVATLTRTHQWATVLVTHHADDIAAIAAMTYRIADGRLRPDRAASSIDRAES